MRKSTTKSDTEDKNLELFELDTECGMKATASFDTPRMSSPGGLALLRDHERGCGIIERLASCIHGGQQLAMFNSYYHGYCYMPLLLFEGESGKMILPELRPGRANKGINIAGLLLSAVTVTVLRKTVKLHFQSGHPSQKEMTAALLSLHPIVA